MAKIQQKNIHPDIYGVIPPVLQFCGEQTTPQDRDVLLLSCIASASACLPNFYGNYDEEEEITPHQYVFFCGNPSTGKSIAEKGTKIAKYIHWLHRTNYKEAVQKHKDNYTEGENIPPPPSKKLYCSENTTAAAFFKDLADNEKNGILLHSSEADSLIDSLQGNYGDFSSALRKAWEHETIRKRILQNDTEIEINTPKITCILAGTPGQAKKLFTKGEENGLLTRFGFYCTQYNDVNFRVQKNKTTPTNTNQNIEACAKLIFSVFQKLEKLGNQKIKFEIQEEGVKIFEHFYNNERKKAEKEGNYSLGSFIFRIGKLAYRQLMVLTALRKLPKQEGDYTPNSTIQADYTDIMTVLEISKIHIYYADVIVGLFDNNPEKLNPSIFSFLSKLGETFKTKDFIDIVKAKGIPKRTAERMLKKAQEIEAIETIRQGIYIKIKP